MQIALLSPAAAALLLGSLVPVQASQPSDPSPLDQPVRQVVSLENIPWILEQSRPDEQFITRDFLHELLTFDDQPWKDKMTARTGLELAFSFRNLAFGLSNVPGGNFAASAEAKLVGRWTLLDRDGANPGALKFSIDQRFRYTDRSVEDLGDALGLLFGPADGYGVRPLAIRQLYWAQSLLDGGLRLRIGKIDPGSFFNTNAFSDSSVFFLNQAFATNVAQIFPDQGLGAHLRINPSRTWYVLGGIQDANALSSEAGFSTIKEGQFFGALEVGWTPAFAQLGAGAYRLTLWGNEEATLRDTPSGYGLGLSADQDLSPNWSVFGLASYRQGSGTPVRAVVSGGLVQRQVPGRPGDSWGTGLGVGFPTKNAPGQEWAWEIFYRLQVTPLFDISPDFQTIFQPGGRRDPQWAVGGGLRARLIF